MKTEQHKEKLNKCKNNNSKLYHTLVEIYNDYDFILSIFTSIRKQEEQEELLKFIEKNKAIITSSDIELYGVIKHRKLDIDTNDINNIKELLK